MDKQLILAPNLPLYALQSFERVPTYATGIFPFSERSNNFVIYESIPPYKGFLSKLLANKSNLVLDEFLIHSLNPATILFLYYNNIIIVNYLQWLNDLFSSLHI